MDVLQVAGVQTIEGTRVPRFSIAGQVARRMETEEDMTDNHNRLSLAVLASTCALLAMPTSDAHAIDVGVSVNAGNAVSADVGASLGGGNGVNADANASVGGSSGVNADATANAGGGRSVDANVNAGVGGGKGLDANANARLGGGRGVNADLNARIGGSDGLDTDATASVRRGSGVDADLAIGRAGGSNKPAAEETLSASQARTLEAFRARPVNEQRKMLVRCADISSPGGVASGGSDSGLAGLCSLLKAIASR
ncbi:hypothetical protein RCCGE510_07451 [Rhizobium sp. CCGE 510]|nr:hypothetical protein RCCGE510_07451 [Rhizobium sp. CCGE 510]